MSEQTQKTEWAIFAPAFWDDETLVAKAADGAWIYPGRGFEPQQEQYYYLSLEPRTSKITQKPYYVGYPRYGNITSLPPEFVQLIQRHQHLQSKVDKLRAHNHDLFQELTELHEENINLQQENQTLIRQVGAEGGKQRIAPIQLNEQTVEKLLANCSFEDLLGSHTPEKQQKVYRQIMQLSHPDKTRDFGQKARLMLEALVKAINAMYHR